MLAGATHRPFVRVPRTGLVHDEKLQYIHCARCGATVCLSVRDPLPPGWTMHSLTDRRWNPATGKMLCRCPECANSATGATREGEGMNFQGMTTPAAATADPWAGMELCERHRIASLDAPLATVRAKQNGVPTSLSLTNAAVDLIGMGENRGVQVLVDRERKLIGIRPCDESCPNVAHVSGFSGNLSCSAALAVVPGKPGYRYPVIGVAGGGIIIDLSGEGEPARRNGAAG